MQTIKPAQYWRETKHIKGYLGKIGEVISTTVIRTTSSEFSYLVPYSYVVVDFAGVKKELMGVSGDLLEIGDQVKCVMRKMSQPTNQGLIEYGLKVQKITPLRVFIPGGYKQRSNDVH